MQRSISDWVTVFILSSVVQKGVQEHISENLESSLYNGPTSSIMNQMLVTGNLDYLALYGKFSQPLYQVATDDSSGPIDLDVIKESAIYASTVEHNGAPYWFPLTEQNNTFIEYNRKNKLGMTRIVRNALNGENIGFIVVGVNQETINKQYLKNLYDHDHGILILDQNGTPLLTAGKEFFSSDNRLLNSIRMDKKNNGSTVAKLNGEELLLSYKVMNNGWVILYAVPLHLLTKELVSIKNLVIFSIIGCLILSIPLAMFFTSILTAPVKKLLISMRRFQNGHFDERVEIKYQDEIGLLGQGYNNMVSNIKTLVDEAYVLRLKEREAELKALQSQINPHFLYNMLDMIFWEAEKSGQERISEMVITLSRFFRLGLNRGKSFTSLGKEKELIEQYLSLQQMRFVEKLSYRMDIPDSLNHFVILKLCLQPFIENALVHGIERKREGGHVHITGWMENGYLHFEIVDSGQGMSPETLSQITQPSKDTDVYTGNDTGGYAIQNVIQRLKHFYKGNYELTYESKEGEGTRVKLIIPAIKEGQEDYDD